MFNKKTLIILLGLVCGSSYGVVYSHFKKYMESKGLEYNATSSDYYKLQGAHYTHGSSVFFRYPVGDVKALKFVELPKPDINHGSFELHAGGFSYISKEEIVNALRSLIQDRDSYAFMLAAVMAPTIGKLMQAIKRLEDKVNSSSVSDRNSNLKQLNNEEGK
ncbi:MAG: conjugal transfer protein TraH [Legionellales bacterium]|nr:conjugal transfer protein TraH [Legionellales bacterium]